MHGYVALDAAGELLVPFRTWRNNITGRACAELTPRLDFAVPQRWTVAHLYQSVLEEQPHVKRIAHLTTLAGYVHWRLTGEHVVGIGEASGIFPVDSGSADWDVGRIAAFDALVAPRTVGWTLREILPAVLPAGHPAGRLTEEGARLLDPSGGSGPEPMCPPQGDAGTGMVATNAVRPRSEQRLGGTSMFAMIVLERSLVRIHEERDIVVTPDGRPVAMAHSNNGTSDLDAWMALLGQVGSSLGAETTTDALYERLLPLALAGEPDAGRLLSINYVSGEHLTGFTEGRPLFAGRTRGSPRENFLRALCYAALCAMRAGLDILRDEEGVIVEEMRARQLLQAATGPADDGRCARCPGQPAGHGGRRWAWGMAVLARTCSAPTPARRSRTTSTGGCRKAWASR